MYVTVTARSVTADVSNMLCNPQVRKLFTCVAYLSQTIFMLLATFLLTPAGAVACLSTAVGLGGFALAGFL
jgi:ACS family sodium-dependent inorganic phosphate cotransporter